MTRNFRNPLFEAEPFEESQGRQAVASPDELHKFYSDMERRELAQKRISRTKASTRPRWRGKSAKSAAGAMQSIDDRLSSSETTLLQAEQQKESKVDESHTPPMLLEDELRGSESLDLFQTTSILPDTRPPSDLPSPFSSSPQSSYTISNPIGPYWYINHHLIPHHVRTPLPPSFSPSFPPMPRAEDAGRMPGPSRTPSGSPLPTPTSSQTRLVDGAPGVRTRKISQTAHDGVDLMDGTDPWGTNWHHGSPYDIGLNQQGQASQTTVDATQTRSKNKLSSSNSSQIHRKTGTPSPLSQSTSAVHLQEEKAPATVKRTLSKRKAGIRRTFFGGSDRAENAPSLKEITPDTSNNRMSVPNDGFLIRRRPSKKAPQLPHSISAGSASSYPVAKLSSLPSYVAEHKGKRGNMLDRLTRRFSILRRPTMGAISSDILNEKIQELTKTESKTSPEYNDVSRIPDKASEEAISKNMSPTKRVPPPVLDDTKTYIVEPKAEIGKKSSESLSVEPPFRIGKLTIANPDVSVSERSSAALPVHNIEYAQMQSSETQNEKYFDTEARNDKEVTRDESSTDRPEVLAVSPTESHPPLVPDKDDVYDPVPLMPLSNTLTESQKQAEEAPVAPIAVPKPFAVMRNNSDATSADHSPVSKASILANPPTPHLPPLSALPSMDIGTNGLSAEEHEGHKASHESPVTEVQVKADDDGQQNKSPKKEKGKQSFTETFKLVRSSSEHVPNSQSITVGDEQWELVEAPDAMASKRRSSKDRERMKLKDTEQTSRKDSSRRRERTQSDVRADQEKARERSVHKGHHSKTYQKDSLKSADRHYRAHSLDPPSRRTSDIGNKSGFVVTQKAKDQDRFSSNRKDGLHADMSSTKLKAIDNKETPINSNYRRIPPAFITQRPVSDTPTFAEWTALSAKEAWEADRLWKGKSVLYGPEVIGVVSSPNVSSHLDKPFGLINGQNALKNSDAVYDVGHGSSHTAYMVQRPFQGQTSQNPFYSQLRVPQAPSVYQLPLANAPTYASPGFYDYPKTYHSLLEVGAQSTTPSRAPLSNPLPEPPRMSSYKATALPSTLMNSTSDDNDPSTAEYWNKYAGITTTH